MNQKKTASILRKFLLFNLIVFSVLGLFTFLYLIAIQPNLVKQRTANHIDIINNTTDHLDRLNIQFNKKGISTFLLSRFNKVFKSNLTFRSDIFLVKKSGFFLINLRSCIVFFLFNYFYSQYR